MSSIVIQGDTSGSITVEAPAVAGTTTLTLPATSSTLATQNSLGVRNLIINGNMQIAQRGTSASGLTTGGYRTIDRWYHEINSAGTWSESKDTDVPSGQGFSSSLKVNCTSTATLTGTDQTFLMQIIEAQNLQHLKYGTANAESLTLSFWVKSNKTGTYVIWFYQPDDNRQTNKTYTIDTADTWEKKTLTISGDTAGIIDNNNGQGILIRWILDTGSNFTSGTSPNGTWEAFSNGNAYAGQTVNLADNTANYINITGVQLEVGTEATPFEHRPYDMELARCQRYYSKGDSANNKHGGLYDGSLYLGEIFFPTTMRATPTIIVSGTGTAGSASTTDFFYTKTGSGCYINVWTASAEL
jgi:hypothetical protein